MQYFIMFVTVTAIKCKHSSLSFKYHAISLIVVPPSGFRRTLYCSAVFLLFSYVVVVVVIDNDVMQSGTTGFGS